MNFADVTVKTVVMKEDYAKMLAYMKSIARDMIFPRTDNSVEFSQLPNAQVNAIPTKNRIKVQPTIFNSKKILTTSRAPSKTTVS